jgi:hypothetical protein
MSGIAGLHPLQTLHTWRRRSHKGRRESLCSACLAIAKTTLSGREWISLRRTAQRQRRYLTDGEPMIADRPGPSDEIATLPSGQAQSLLCQRIPAPVLSDRPNDQMTGDTINSFDLA